MFKIINGLIEGVKYLPSPNYNQRPENSDIDLLVVHNISLPPGQFGGPYVEHLFTNCLDPQADPYFQHIASLQVSAHVFLRRQGELIQFVPFHLRAWHAGKSSLAGREDCNNTAIGIELEGADDIAYEAIQYQILAKLIHTLKAYYPIQQLVGHQHIAPGRKTDPGSAFNWPLLFKLLDRQNTL